MTPEEILKQEYSEEFDKLCKNRVLTSFYKYGPAKINYGQGLVNAIESALMCIAKFQKNRQHGVSIGCIKLFKI